MRRALAGFSTRLIDLILARPGRFAVGGAVALGALTAVAFTLRADAGVEAFLPASDRHLGAYVEALHRFGAAETVLVDVESDDSEALHPGAQGVESAMRASGLFREVFGSADGVELGRTAAALGPAAPLLLPPAAYAVIEERLRPEALADRMEEHYERLLSPAGGSYSAYFRADPLEIGALVFERVASSSVVAGAKIERGRLVSQDGRHALVAAIASSPVGEEKAARAVTAVLDGAAAALPPGVRLTWIGGHRFYLSNATTLQADITRVSIAGVAMVLGVVMAGFWNARVVALALLAMVAGAAAAGATAALAFPAVSGIALAVAAAFCGINVDYVIHLHVAPAPGETRRDALRRVYVETLPSVAIGAATSAAAFLVLLASEVPAHGQIGLTSAAAIAGAFFSAALVGPVIAVWGHGTASDTSAAKESPIERVAGRVLGVVLARPRPALVVALALVGASLATLPGVRFENDLRAFESKDAATVDAEARFSAAWGDLFSQTMIVVPGADADEALARTERVVSALEPFRGTQFGAMSSVAALLPSRATQTQHRAAWDAFWTPERIAGARRDLGAAAAQFGIRADSFEPFLESIRRPQEPLGASQYEGTSLAGIVRRHLDTRGDGAESLVVLAAANSSGDPAATWPAAVRAAVPESRILSRRGLADAVAEASRRQLVVLALPGLALIAILLFAYYRSARLAAVGMFPLAGGLAVAAAVHVVAGIPLSLMNVCVAVPIFGLGIDYAVFLIDALLDAPGPASENGTFLSRRSAPILAAALTTLVGGASMLIARHPAVWVLGFALTVGVASSLLLTWLAVPAMSRWAARSGP